MVDFHVSQAIQEMREISQAVEKAKNQALHFLSFRLRSVKEVGSFLARKKNPPEVILAVISDLTEKGFIGDEQFAKWWADSRIGNGFGPMKIKSELLAKGVNREIVDSTLKRDWIEVIRTIAKTMSGKLTSVSPSERNRKLKNALFGRGFTWSQIQQTFDDMRINR